MIASKQMNWKKKTIELFNHISPTPKEVFYLLTHTLLTLLIPLSFLLLANLSGAQYYLQALTLYHSPQPFSFLFTFALNINPCILYILLSIVSIATLIQGLTGRITLLNEPLSSTILQPGLYTAWVLLCIFQFCVGLGIEGSIAAGIYDYESTDSSFGVQRSFLSRMIFLLGLHETTQAWSRMIVRPVVNDTVFGVERKERWVEKVAIAASLGTLWWWRLKEEVETLVIMAEVKKEQLIDVGICDFVGWWLYYLIVTIGMVRVVKGLVWIFMISLCRRRATRISHLESSDNDDKV
ncbi:unnamed protein product [Lupinus luteus]|uniref:Transmembrane protein n=1 Tax=Lupinus luteus TaxID=3873 RepID=A0AAV1XI76_LUPLU